MNTAMKATAFFALTFVAVTVSGAGLRQQGSPLSSVLEAHDASNEVTPEHGESCSFTFLTSSGSQAKRYFVKSSEYSACMHQISIEPSHWKSYVLALNAFLAEWYTFYDVAVDAPATEPRGVGPEDLGNYIYNGTLHGQVDLRKKLQGLARIEGPKLSDFWTLFGLQVALRDNHVFLKGKTTLGSPELDGAIFPLTSLTPRKGNAYFPTFRMVDGDPGKIEMDITDTSTDMHKRIEFPEHDVADAAKQTATTTRRVKLFNGMNAKELLYYLADGNFRIGACGQCKDSGARINGVIKNWHEEANDSKRANWLADSLLTDPAAFFPDEFTVEYESGVEEVWVTQTNVSPDVAQAIKNKQRVPASWFSPNVPGQLYSDLKKAMHGNGDTTNNAALVSLAAQLQQPAPHKASTLSETHGLNGGEKKFFVGQGEGLGYYIGDTYAVLKYETFDNTKIVQVWHEMITAAQEKGVKHLIVDISGNTGGSVVLGYDLMQFMYPDMPFEHFKNLYNVRYTDSMESYASKILPFLTKIHTLPHEERQKILKNVSLEQVSKIAGLITMIHRLAEGLNPPEWFTKERTAIDALVLAGAKWVQNRGNLELAHDMFSKMMVVLEDCNPWNVLPAVNSEKIPMDQTPLKLKRGKQSNVKFTQPFLMYTQEMYEGLQTPQTPFTSYVVLSNGVSGSTANTFESTLTSWAVTGALPDGAPTYTTVSYGGNGATPLTQYGCGAVEQPVLNRIFVAQTALYAVATGLSGTEFGSIARKLYREFADTIPNMPYYASDLPWLPAVQIMNKGYGGMDAMPSEYMYNPPLHTINKFYKGTFEDSTIWELYDETAKFFPTK